MQTYTIVTASAAGVTSTTISDVEAAKPVTAKSAEAETDEAFSMADISRLQTTLSSRPPPLPRPSAPSSPPTPRPSVTTTLPTLPFPVLCFLGPTMTAGPLRRHTWRPRHGERCLGSPT